MITFYSLLSFPLYNFLSLITKIFFLNSYFLYPSFSFSLIFCIFLPVYLSLSRFLSSSLSFSISRYRSLYSDGRICSLYLYLFS